jgi:hypothetical protein
LAPHNGYAPPPKDQSPVIVSGRKPFHQNVSEQFGQAEAAADLWARYQFDRNPDAECAVARLRNAGGDREAELDRVILLLRGEGSAFGYSYPGIAQQVVCERFVIRHERSERAFTRKKVISNPQGAVVRSQQENSAVLGHGNSKACRRRRPKLPARVCLELHYRGIHNVGWQHFAAGETDAPSEERHAAYHSAERRVAQFGNLIIGKEQQ